MQKFLLVLLSAAFISCQEIKKKILPSFSVKIPDINLSIPPINFVSDKEVPIGALRAHINLDSAIRANTAGTFGADAVTSIEVKKVGMQLLNADKNNHLGNFESARMRIFSNNDTSATDIAVINFPDVYSDSLIISNANSPEISNYLKATEIGYNLYWKNRRTTTKNLILKLSITINVQ